jgi:hypothetical protein
MAVKKKSPREFVERQKKTGKKPIAKKKIAKRGPGRPTKKTKALAAKICQQLAQGKSMRTVCKAKSMPNAATVFRWLADDKEFSEQYARAKEESADAMSEDMLDIADNVSLHPNDKRVRIDTRKWLASKLKPKKYGDKLTHIGDENEPVHVITRRIRND